MITQSQLQTGLPPIRYNKKNQVNVVLAVWSRQNYGPNGSNSYIPAWHVVNTEYYCKHPTEYDGWIELEDIASPF